MNLLLHQELCDIVCGMQATEDEHIVVIKGWAWSATIFRQALSFKWCWVSTKSPKVFPTLLQHHQPNPTVWMSQEKWRHIRPQKNFQSLIVWLGEPTQIVDSVLRWQKWHPVKSICWAGVVFCHFSPSASMFDVLSTLTGQFFFFRPFSENPGDGLVGKSQ